MFYLNSITSRATSKVCRIGLLILPLLAVFSLSAADNQRNVGDITIHYNVLSAALIPAEVALLYDITRSSRTGIVNISVKKNGKAVVANIFGNGKNLTAQLKKLSFKEIKEGDAVYYIATFSFRNKENLIFDLQVQPEKKGKLLSLKFKQQLYTE